MIIAKAAAFDLHDAGTDITICDMFSSKGRGVRFFRYVLGVLFNIYIPYRWSVYMEELVPNRAQLKPKIIPKGKYVHVKNSFFLHLTLLLSLNYKSILD